MDEFLDSFLYILISIVVLVVSAIRGGKKQKEARKNIPDVRGYDPMEDEETSRDEFDFRSLFEEVEEQPETAPPPVRRMDHTASMPKEHAQKEFLEGKSDLTESYVGKPTHEKEERDSNAVFSKEVEASFADPNQIRDEIAKGSIVGEGEDKRQKQKIAFDVREAIIYAEILNRKYT